MYITILLDESYKDMSTRTHSFDDPRRCDGARPDDASHMNTHTHTNIVRESEKKEIKKWYEPESIRRWQ